jgi:hypothetical protein
MNHKGGTGILKIGKALGIGTSTVQCVVMEPRPFDVGARSLEIIHVVLDFKNASV